MKKNDKVILIHRIYFYWCILTIFIHQNTYVKTKHYYIHMLKIAKLVRSFILSKVGTWVKAYPYKNVEISMGYFNFTCIAEMMKIVVLEFKGIVPWKSSQRTYYLAVLSRERLRWCQFNFSILCFIFSPTITWSIFFANFKILHVWS